MLILAGTNDIARGVAVSTIRNNLSLIADLAVANRIKPIFASIRPASDCHKDKDPSHEMTKTRPPATIEELEYLAPVDVQAARLHLRRLLLGYCRRPGVSQIRIQ